MMRLRTLLLAAALLAGPLASAQFFQAGTDPFARWSEMGTEHFRIVFPEGMDSLARAYVLDLEKWQPVVGRSARMAPGSLHWGRLPVVLHPWNPYSNGSVAWAPKQMNLYTHPEPYGSIPQAWMTQLTTHESRHVTQMQLVYRRPFRWLNYVVGEMWSGAVSAIYSPPAFLEGDAVVAETALTASGRGRDADFLNYYHVAFDNGDWRDWYKWVYGSFKKAGPDYYTVGYMTIAGMRYFYDRPAFTADYYDYVTRHHRAWAPFEKYVKTVSGKSFKKTFQGIMEGFHNIWTEEADARGPFMEMEQVTRKHAFATDYWNGSWIDGSYYALKRGKNLAERLVRIDTDGTEHDLGPFSTYTSTLTPGEHRLYWSETLPGKRWTLDGESFIRYMDAKGKRHDLTKKGRLYNPKPGPEGLACVEYPVRGGSNLVLVDEADGQILRRIPAPEGIQLTEPAWLDDTIYCLGLDDRGYGIWRLNHPKNRQIFGGPEPNRAEWTCVLEPSVQKMENLDGVNHVLDFVSDRSGVKELYRYDPETGRAWQQTNTRYGGTDYFWHGDTLWFNSMTPEGTAIFKAKAPEPVEVDIRQVHTYRVAEKLSEQERFLHSLNSVEMTGSASAGTTEIAVSEPKPYRKALHLMKFHSWAPVYFNYDAVESLSGDFTFDTASPGLIGLFQNDLGTAWGTVGYSAYPDLDKSPEWRHSGHVQFTYTGLYPVIEAGFHLYDTGGGRYQFQRRRYTDRVGYAITRDDVAGPYWTASVKAYIPFRHNKGGLLRGWVPQMSWSISNNAFDNGTVNLAMADSFFEGARASLVDITPGDNLLMQTLRASVRGYRMLPTAESQVYPRWGIGAETGASFRPGLTKIYSPVWYGYMYGYLPGFARTQGLRLSATAQYQLPTGAPFGENSVTILPRGFTSADARAVARKSHAQLRLTADYALPVYVGDISWLSPVAYFRNFLLVPHVDGTIFPVRSDDRIILHNLVSAGADFTLELGNLTWIPYPFSIGVSASWLGGSYFKNLSTKDTDEHKPYYVGLLFSVDL